MVTISNTTLRANVYETVYDILTAANLLGGSVTVTAAYIDSTESFPQVVVNPANISKDTFSFDRSNSTNTISVMIDIYTKKNKQIDQITDAIDSLSSLKSITGLQLTDWEESKAFEPQNNNKIHLKSITLVYKRR